MEKPQTVQIKIEFAAPKSADVLSHPSLKALLHPDEDRIRIARRQLHDVSDNAR